MWKCDKLKNMRGITAGAEISNLLTNEYAEKWVAISPDRKRVICTADSLIELDKKVKPTEPNAIYTKALDNSVSYTF